MADANSLMITAMVINLKEGSKAAFRAVLANIWPSLRSIYAPESCSTFTRKGTNPFPSQEIVSGESLVVCHMELH